MLVLNNEASIHAQGAMCSFVLNVIEAKCELKRFPTLSQRFVDWRLFSSIQN